MRFRVLLARVGIVLSCFVVAAAISVSSRAATPTSTYRGFTLTERDLQDAPNLPALRAALQVQIDIVHEVGLTEEMLKFFQSVPLLLVREDTIARASPGLYAAERKAVLLTTRMANLGRRPVLIHELLHAYHWQRLPNGVGNREVVALWERAKKLGVYTANSHMMQNPGEFFACAGTTYLYGSTAQEPFKRAKIAEGQPELFVYLQKLFGEKAGTHEGVIGASEQKKK